MTSIADLSEDDKPRKGQNMVRLGWAIILLVSVPRGVSAQVPDTLWSRIYNIMPDLDQVTYQDAVKG
jgi:hypothetical protein